MSDKIELGKTGEKIATQFLRKKEYKILETNWRYRKAEIDIIAKKEDVLIFVEVKTRSENYFGRPESFVTERKRALMIDAANAYMEKINHNWEIRFDIVAIIYHNPIHQTIDHFKDAFFPGLK